MRFISSVFVVFVFNSNSGDCSPHDTSFMDSFLCSLFSPVSSRFDVTTRAWRSSQSKLMWRQVDRRIVRSFVRSWSVIYDCQRWVSTLFFVYVRLRPFGCISSIWRPLKGSFFFRCRRRCCCPYRSSNVECNWIRGENGNYDFPIKLNCTSELSGGIDSHLQRERIKLKIPSFLPWTQRMRWLLLYPQTDCVSRWRCAVRTIHSTSIK